MLKGYVCVLILVGVTCGSIDEDVEKYYKGIFNELPCLTFGGQCTKNCPDDKLASSLKGLCPQQQEKGIECCKDVPQLAEKCEAKGGKCLPKDSICSKEIVLKNATNCEKDGICCFVAN